MSDEKLKDFHTSVKKYNGKLTKKENVVIEEILKQINVIQKERETKKIIELRNIIKEVSETKVDNSLKISETKSIDKLPSDFSDL